MNPRDFTGSAGVENDGHRYRTHAERIEALVTAWRTARLVHDIQHRHT